MAKSLRCVSQLLTGSRDLFGKHAQMIGEAEHIFEDIDSADEVLPIVDTCAGECFDEPECAHTEGTFATSDSCVVLARIKVLEWEWLAYHLQSGLYRSGRQDQRKSSHLSQEGGECDPLFEGSEGHSEK
jgi:hypothetical protein